MSGARGGPIAVHGMRAFKHGKLRAFETGIPRQHLEMIETIAPEDSLLAFRLPNFGAPRIVGESHIA